MANYFIDRIAGLLHELNGGIGDISDYYYVAWLGIKDKSGRNSISQSDLVILRLNFENNILNNENSMWC
jgi:hypothetical protein